VQRFPKSGEEGFLGEQKEEWGGEKVQGMSFGGAGHDIDESFKPNGGNRDERFLGRGNKEWTRVVKSRRWIKRGIRRVGRRR